MEEKAKELYMQMELLKREIESLQTQKEILSNRLGETVKTIENLKLIEGREGEGYAYLSAGIYVKSKIEKVEKVLMHAGRKIFVESEVKEAIDKLEKDKSSLQEVISSIDEKIKNLATELNKVITEFERIQKK